MSNTRLPRCKACGELVSLERGITAVGDLNASGVDYYCEPCAPNRGKGYTLSDLERWREELRTERAVQDLKRNIAKMAAETAIPRQLLDGPP